MPIYEYTCPNCQNVFEEWLKASEAAENTPCPKCGSQARRIISNTAFVLKGGGWYVTDYGYRKGTNEDGRTTGGDSGASSTSASTDDSAPGASPAPAAAAPSQPASSTANGASA
ncbi:MAG: zinc ribbon domain-containing protein [Betaproteobacteria bacterium]|nr:zinc ribbon domain-containing protein [Betaproteobacteria bacterium]